MLGVCMERTKEWRTVSRYPQYEVSNDGEVRHIGKDVRKQTTMKNGYNYISMWIAETRKTKVLPVHRLVAEAFHDNPQGKRCINHKDGNKQNNSVENIEWCTDNENQLHMTYVLGHNHHPPQAVECVESGITYPSYSIAGKCTGVSCRNISLAAKGKRPTAGGYHWRWIEKGE